LLSKNSGKKLLVLEIAAGCDDYIAKPIKADELEQMIIKNLKEK